MYQINTFYEFKPLSDLDDLKTSLKDAMCERSIKGTIILAEEGFNGTVCGSVESIASFINFAGRLLATTLDCKSSFHDSMPFEKIDVKIKPEIVTLKKKVNMNLSEGTHVPPKEWNRVISDPETLVLDTRNEYEFENGTFTRAINPKTEKFSDLPTFVSKNLDHETHKKIAMFCTGGIRCEKFAPYLVAQGFHEVYQLEGGILRYLEEVSPDESLWQGECFVFDNRTTLNERLKKGSRPDHSQALKRKSAVE